MFKLPAFRNWKRAPRHESLADFLRRHELSGLAARPAMNTLVNRVSRIVPGFGSPIGSDTLFENANVALSTTGQGTTTLPSTGTWTAPNTLSSGWIRVRIYAGIGTSPTLTDLLITGSDGTNTVQLAQVHPNSAVTLSTTSSFDELFPFMTELTLTSITIKTTLGGTSPGATMDCEVAGTAGLSPTQA